MSEDMKKQDYLNWLDAGGETNVAHNHLFDDEFNKACRSAIRKMIEEHKPQEGEGKKIRGSVCAKCGGQIVWVETKSGEKMAPHVCHTAPQEALVGDTASWELMLATLDRLLEGKVVARRAVNAIRKLILETYDEKINRLNIVIAERDAYIEILKKRLGQSSEVED